MRATITALVASYAVVTSSAAAVAAGKPGLPQLNPDDFAPQLFWLAITFTLLYLIMSRVALPRIGEVIEERKDRIKNDLAAAERLKGETEKALAAYEKALAEARNNASGIARSTHDALTSEVNNEKAAIEAQLAQRLADAETRIAATKNKALASVSEIASDAVTAIVGQLTGTSVSKDDALRAISEAK